MANETPDGWLQLKRADAVRVALRRCDVACVIESQAGCLVVWRQPNNSTEPVNVAERFEEVVALLGGS